jgi:glutamate-ammonia-ligase adenylyltransferase
VDYGSDLDLIIIYDSSVPSPIASLTQDEAYARLGELMIAALSSVTREGYLYRIDLRLRPDGNKGPLVSASQSFLDYLKQRATVWEWLAYVKVRAVAGDLELGRAIETQARQVIHEAARQIDPQELRMETRHVRTRLEREKVKAGRRAGIDIKYGAGGMLDVYFAVRYLQLRDDIRDEGEDRSTASTLARLRAAGSLGVEDHAVLSDGYGLLRAVDHHLRLIVGRSARLPAPDHLALRDIARNLGYFSATALTDALGRHMVSIRAAYERITRV